MCQGEKVRTPDGEGLVIRSVELFDVVEVELDNGGEVKQYSSKEIVKISDNFNSYDSRDLVSGELKNSLLIVNEIVRTKGQKVKPEFYILGGAALIFHGLNYLVTLDIDTANQISNDIKNSVRDFINDEASYVTTLGFNYKSRAIKICPELDMIDVYILSKADLIITKLDTKRNKDISAIMSSGLLDAQTIQDARSIIETEFGGKTKDSLSRALDNIIRTRSMCV